MDNRCGEILTVPSAGVEAGRHLKEPEHRPHRGARQADIDPMIDRDHRDEDGGMEDAINRSRGLGLAYLR